MLMTKETCFELKEEIRKKLRQLSIDEKIKRVEQLRDRVEIIRNLRRKKGNGLKDKKEI